jgi:hypothetical protein
MFVSTVLALFSTVSAGSALGLLPDSIRQLQAERAQQQDKLQHLEGPLPSGVNATVFRENVRTFQKSIARSYGSFTELFRLIDHFRENPHSYGEGLLSSTKLDVTWVDFFTGRASWTELALQKTPLGQVFYELERMIASPNAGGLPSPELCLQADKEAQAILKEMEARVQTQAQVQLQIPTGTQTPALPAAEQAPIYEQVESLPDGDGDTRELAEEGSWRYELDMPFEVRDSHSVLLDHQLIAGIGLGDRGVLGAFDLKAKKFTWQREVDTSSPVLCESDNGVVLFSGRRNTEFSLVGQQLRTSELQVESFLPNICTTTKNGEIVFAGPIVANRGCSDHQDKYFAFLRLLSSGEIGDFEQPFYMDTMSINSLIPDSSSNGFYFSGKMQHSSKVPHRGVIGKHDGQSFSYWTLEEKAHSIVLEGEKIFGATDTGLVVLDTSSGTGFNVKFSVQNKFPVVDYSCNDSGSTSSLIISDTDGSIYLFLARVGTIRLSSGAQSVVAKLHDPTFRHVSDVFSADGEIIYTGATYSAPNLGVIGGFQDEHFMTISPELMTTNTSYSNSTFSAPLTLEGDNFFPLNRSFTQEDSGFVYPNTSLAMKIGRDFTSFPARSDAILDSGWGVEFDKNIQYGASSSVLLDPERLVMVFDVDTAPVVGLFNLKSMDFVWTTQIQDQLPNVMYRSDSSKYTVVCRLGESKIAAFAGDRITELDFNGSIVRRSKLDLEIPIADMRVIGCATTGQGDVIAAANLNIHYLRTMDYRESCKWKSSPRILVSVLMKYKAGSGVTKAVEIGEEYQGAFLAINSFNRDNTEFVVSSYCGSLKQHRVYYYCNNQIFVKFDQDLQVLGVLKVPDRSRSAFLINDSIVGATNRGLLTHTAGVSTYRDFVVGSKCLVLVPSDPITIQESRDFGDTVSFLPTDSASYLFVPRIGILKFSRDGALLEQVVRDFRFSRFDAAHKAGDRIVFTGRDTAYPSRSVLVSVPEAGFSSYCSRLFQGTGISADESSLKTDWRERAFFSILAANSTVLSTYEGTESPISVSPFEACPV